MKKILLFLVTALALFTSAMSQTSAPGTVILIGTNTNALGTDTLVTSGTIYFKNPSSLSAIGLEGKYNIALTAVAISGTISATCTLEGSSDGVVWSTGINKVPGTDGNMCDTLTLSAAGTYYFTITSNSAKQLLSSGVVNQTYYTGNTRRYYIRVKIVSGATQSTRMYARLITQN